MNFYFPFVSNSLAYITISKNNRKIKINYNRNLGPVVPRPISANSGLNFSPGFFFFCQELFLE